MSDMFILVTTLCHWNHRTDKCHPGNGTYVMKSGMILIGRHWTYKMPVRYILSSVWGRLSISSQLSIIQHMALCVFSLPISLVMIERIITLCYYHHQIGSMNYWPLFSLRSWNNSMCCMSLYILIISPVSEGSGDVMVLCRSRPPPAARHPPPAARRPPPAARNGVNAITQKPLDGLFSNLVYTLVVIVSWPD